MRVRLGLALLALAVVVTGPIASRAADGSWSVEQALKQLDHESGNFRSLSADVERTKVTVVVDDHSTESGKILVRRDDKMRIDLTSPDPRTILRNGDRFYNYNPKIRRVEEYDLSKHRDLVDEFFLLGFGTSGENLKKSYLVTVEGEEILGNQKVLHLELTPKSDEVRHQISKIELWMDEANWLPAQQEFHETGTGNYFIIRYTNIVRNVNLADSRFRPEWPSGVARVKPQG